jgi:hypothetical protein
VIDDVNVPITDDEDRDRIVWPESSSLNAWWADVMSHRFPRTQATSSS